MKIQINSTVEIFEKRHNQFERGKINSSESENIFE